MVYKNNYLIESYFTYKLLDTSKEYLEVNIKVNLLFCRWQAAVGYHFSISFLNLLTQNTQPAWSFILDEKTITCVVKGDRATIQSINENLLILRWISLEKILFELKLSTLHQKQAASRN